MTNPVDQLKSQCTQMTDLILSDELLSLTKATAKATVAFYNELIEGGVPQEVAGTIAASYSSSIVPSTR